MNRTQSLVSRLLSEESGQGMTEYTLAVGFVALATAAAASVFASGVTKSITLSIAKALGKI